VSAHFSQQRFVCCQKVVSFRPDSTSHMQRIHWLDAQQSEFLGDTFNVGIDGTSTASRFFQPPITA
jgi:hypothetical protein